MSDNAKEPRVGRAKRKFDWICVVVHFVCGASVGLAIGICVVVRYRQDVHYLVPIIGLSLLVGTLAAMGGDQYWRRVAKHYMDSEWRRTPYWY